MNKDIPDNCVVAGVPARAIGKIEDFIAKRGSEESYPEEIKPVGQRVSQELEQYLWTKFYKKHTTYTES